MSLLGLSRREEWWKDAEILMLRLTAEYGQSSNSTAVPGESGGSHYQMVKWPGAVRLVLPAWRRSSPAASTRVPWGERTPSLWR